MRIKGAVPASEFYKMVAESKGAKSKGPRETKYQAERTKTELGSFDSKHEARWAQQLDFLRAGGYIDNLRVHKRELLFVLDVNGRRICQYEADARFDCLRDYPLETHSGTELLRAGQHYVLDAKSPPTRKKPDYTIKRELMVAIHGIKILEV
jgi:hypothetical protein